MPKTLGGYLKEDWRSIAGKTFGIPDWTYICRSVSRNQSGEVIAQFEVIDPNGFSDPWTYNLSENPGLLDYVELVEGVNASKRITPAAQALIEKYHRAAPD